MLEDLMLESILEFAPTKGTFDVDLVITTVTGLGFNFRDPVDPDIFVVTAHESLRDEFEARRKADPESMLPPTLRISVNPDRIFVGRSAFEEDEPMTRQFIGWLTGAYPCRITNDQGTDMGSIRAG